MVLNELFSDPTGGLMHMERYVNKGSPSGFLAEKCTSHETSPASDLPYFDLPLVPVRVEDAFLHNLDKLPPILLGDNQDEILYPCHPDILSEGLNTFLNKSATRRMVEAIPTSSARTVLVIEAGCYFKLHYPHEIGRFSRANPYKKWISSFENSDELENGIRLGIAPREFAMLMEKSGILVGKNKSENSGAGVIIREDTPYPYSRTMQSILIPFFSLFSRDRTAPEDPPLLVQILRCFDDPLDTLMNLVVRPLLRCFEFQALEIGLLPENNAQNLLLEVSSDFQLCRIVHRDMMGTFKDLTVRRQKGLTTVLNSYHSVDCTVELEECCRRRSFSYDFKTGEYIFREFEELLEATFGVPRKEFRDLTKESFRTLVTGDIREYFGSDSHWWAYEKVHPAGGRPYVKMKDPQYR